MAETKSPAKQPDLKPEQSEAIAATIREELARRRMSRQKLADIARVSLSTLEKALNGSRPFTLATIVRLEAALAIALRPGKTDAPALRAGSAPAELGAYTADAVRWLEGDYLTLRPSFGADTAIFAYRTTIAWDAAAGCLAFHESDRQDAAFAQKGVVSVPNKSGHIYLHTSDDGQFRLVILGRPLKGGEMYGLMTTLQAGQGTQLFPVSSPFALVPFGGGGRTLGRLGADDEAYAGYQSHLTRVIDGGFARLLTL